MKKEIESKTSVTHQASNGVKILYIANVRLPTEKAHGIQIMKACEAFKNAGHDIELAITNRHSPIAEDPFAYYGIKSRFPLRRLFTFNTVGWGALGYVFESVMFGIVAGLYARRSSADIVYGRDEIVLAIVGMFTNKKMFWESHDGAWNRWAAHIVRRAAGVIVVTDGAVGFYRERGVSAEKLLAVSNGIDLDDFALPESKEASRKRLGLPRDEKIALYAGKLDGWKGVDTLLEASKLMHSVKVAIIGGDRVQIASLSARYPQVHFLGFRPYRELANNQAAGDILVVPNTGKDKISVQFTSPLKLLAAMASGRPVVASDLPSTRFLAGDTSLFVPPDDPPALAEAIETLIKNPERAQELAAAARKRVAQFTWRNRAAYVLTFITRSADAR